MAFTPSPAWYPERTPDPKAPRFLDLIRGDPKGAGLLLAGTCFDSAVIGRKGCKDGPTAIREAFRFLGSYDPVRGTDLAGLRVHDLGDAPVDVKGVLATHRLVQAHAAEAFLAGPPVVLLGGDNSLSFPHVAGLHEARPGRIGLVVLDSHYDLRPYQGEPTSGTPYRRILEELGGKPVQGRNLVEVGLRSWANTKALADEAVRLGIHVVTRDEVRTRGAREVAKRALELAGDGVEHLFLSVDIDALDQSVAPGCSAPGPDGLLLHEAVEVVHIVAADARCRGMDLVEVAPNLDPSGNTARAAAHLVATFAGGVVSRKTK
ncbi:MAG TPA: agmatinase family protein [Candidatus Thermoplasmatota archaeon]|nr:agmatinase family protein [Candidatus Thermoplasmatota archaeon]